MNKEWSKEVFAKNLRHYMEQAGKNQKEMAEIIGVSAPTFNEWLKAKKYPRIDKIEKLAHYFGILKSDLIEDKTEEQKNKPAILIDELKCLSDEKIQLIDFVKSVPEDKAAMVLRVIKSIVEAD